MTSFQKIIKYCATAFAIFLIVTIIGGAVTGLLAISGLTSLKNGIEENKADSASLQQYTLKTDKIEKLDIDVGAADIIIVKGDVFKIEHTSDSFDFKQKQGTLKIESELDDASGFFLFFSASDKKQLLITVPEKMSFEKVSICAGAGDIYIESLKCDELDFDLGAGQLEADYIKVKKQGDIDGGAGEITVLSGNMKDMDISLGVGETNITAKLDGKNEIDTGVGEFNLTLMGEKSDYTVSAETGIGEFKVGGEKISDSYNVGDGESLIDIDGGIGSVKVEFQQ